MPALQGHGVARKLMAEGLATADRSGHGTYAETTSADALPLYLEHHFDRRGSVIFSGAPPIQTLRRPARTTPA